MAAAGACRQYLLHVVFEEKPDLPGKRHPDMKIGEECPGIRMAVVMITVMHDNPFLVVLLPSIIAHL
jgi:hypothetical protein